ncbi:hypothetical protein OROGR_008852 [Orobanche gracilis]
MTSLNSRILHRYHPQSMDFFKSVFSDPTPAATLDPSTPPTPTVTRNPETTPDPTSSWAFGSTLLKTLASKSESLIDNYYKDLQELGAGLKKETSVIRQAASRAVHDLPDRLESGAAIAQESLEAVGQAIDNVGSTVSELIGKELIFASNASDDINPAISDNRDVDLSNLGGNSKPYSRMDGMIRALQGDIRTYCDEVEENSYNEWEIGFKVEEKSGEIDRLIEENGVIKEIYNEIVPVKVDEGTFWCRYFYRVDKVVRAEEARARIVKKAILGEEEEELSWDFDEDDDDHDDSEKDRYNKSKDESAKVDEEKGKGLNNPQVEIREIKDQKRDDENDGGVSGTKSNVLIDEEKLIYNEKEVLSDGKLGSDISVISSQRSSHAMDGFGWDEIEDIGSGNESNVSRAIALHKRLGSAEEEEVLTWDDDDDEPVKL